MTKPARGRPAFRLASALLVVAGCAERRGSPGPPSALIENAIFTRYSSLSRTAEIARRTLTPLNLRRGETALAGHGERLREQPVDLTKEKFTLYIPAGPPPKAGYGMLVFVAPGTAAATPRYWQVSLDRHDLIFVSAANSGNDAPVLDRRLPLALLAYENVRARYPLNPTRVYVGGFSGGSRAAEIIALAYPDVFRGALLDAGSDAIGGNRGLVLPPADLFHEFRATRIVFATGEHDEYNLREDQVSLASLKDWCVFNVQVKTARGMGHELLDEASFERALSALDDASRVDSGELARCDAHVEGGLAAELKEVDMRIERGDRKDARELLNAIDRRYGGLAAPRSLELDAKLAHRQ